MTAAISIDPPDTGIGKGFIPAARLKRTGGLSITRQPVSVDLHRPPALIAEIEI